MRFACALLARAGALPVEPEAGAGRDLPLFNGESAFYAAQRRRYFGQRDCFGGGCQG